jgi:glycosyltransferase involved in cell wall biosynthesis
MIMENISVVMAIYNGEKFLRKQLDSICRQTCGDLEIIAVDDGSSDGSVQILEEYHDKHGLTYYINEKNLGYLKTFEKALSFCTGDLIAFADQDDLWMPDKIERLVHEIGDHSLIYSDAQIIDENDAVLYGSLTEYTRSGRLPPEKDQFKKTVFYWQALGCMMLFRRELLEDLIPFEDDGTAHDRQVSILAARKNKIKQVNTPLTLYRVHSNNTFGVPRGSLWREFSPRYLFPWDLEIKRIESYLAKHYAENEEDVRYLHDILRYFASKKKKGLHFEAMLIALKYRNVIFNDFNSFEKALLIFGNILYFDKLYLSAQKFRSR